MSPDMVSYTLKKTQTRNKSPERQNHLRSLAETTLKLSNEPQLSGFDCECREVTGKWQGFIWQKGSSKSNNHSSHPMSAGGRPLKAHCMKPVQHMGWRYTRPSCFASKKALKTELKMLPLPLTPPQCFLLSCKSFPVDWLALIALQCPCIAASLWPS